MPDEPGVFITVTEACALLGVSRWWMWDRIRRGELKTYALPKDRRLKLLRRADVEALRQPQEDGGKDLAA